MYLSSLAQNKTVIKIKIFCTLSFMIFCKVKKTILIKVKNKRSKQLSKSKVHYKERTVW